jgi:hypothetical protein
LTITAYAANAASASARTSRTEGRLRAMLGVRTGEGVVAHAPVDDLGRAQHDSTRRRPNSFDVSGCAVTFGSVRDFYRPRRPDATPGPDLLARIHR